MNCFWALRGIPAEGVTEEWAGSRRRTREAGGDLPLLKKSLRLQVGQAHYCDCEYGKEIKYAASGCL
jgi:hypothetical protein